MRKVSVIMQLVVIVIAAAIGGGIAWAGTLSGSGPAPRGGPGHLASLTSHYGEVTGYIDACAGIVRPGLPYAAGTVTALRGRETWKPVGSESNGTYQTYRMQLPTAVAARQHVRENQMFHFDLPPGRYVLVGRYDSGNVTTFVDVSVSAGDVLRQNLPNLCK